MKPGPAIAQQLGPMGVNMGKVISDVNEATKGFKGMKVPVELDVDEKTKEYKIHTSSPPTSELLKKELNLQTGTPDHKKQKMGNASIEDIIKVAKIKHTNMLEKELKSAVKSVLGTASSIGILVENKEPNELIQTITKGKFDKEINEGLDETSPEKRQKLNDYFAEVKASQDATLELEKKEAEKAAEEAEKKTAKESTEAATEEKKEEAPVEEKK